MNAKLKKLILTPFNILYRINPAMELKLMYWLKLRKKPDLENPKTYLEKLNWMKLNYRDDRIIQCADKFHARKYIEDCGLGEYLPKLYWHGDSPKDIPWDALPDAFVVKVTSGSGGNIICRDKKNFDRAEAEAKLKKWLHEKYLPCYGEWMYGLTKPSIIVEEFLNDGVNLVPEDYKFFCFNGLNGGDVGCIAMDLGRYVEHIRNIYDNEWNRLPHVNFNFITSDQETPKPARYDEMRRAAQILCRPFPHVRVDFYVIGDRFYLGELTFFNGAGFDKINPPEYDLQMGSWINLPGK